MTPLVRNLVRDRGSKQLLVQGQELRYGSADFIAASDLARRLPRFPPSRPCSGGWSAIRLSFG